MFALKSSFPLLKLCIYMFFKMRLMWIWGHSIITSQTKSCDTEYNRDCSLYESNKIQMESSSLDINLYTNINSQLNKDQEGSHLGLPNINSLLLCNSLMVQCGSGSLRYTCSHGNTARHLVTTALCTWATSSGWGRSLATGLERVKGGWAGPGTGPGSPRGGPRSGAGRPYIVPGSSVCYCCLGSLAARTSPGPRCPACQK